MDGESNHRSITGMKPEELASSISSRSVMTDPGSSSEDTKKSKTTKKRKKKVEIACVYCRRSHMICDDSRPCQRCIKRGISHLCHDEPSNSRQRKKAEAMVKQPEPNEPHSQPIQSQSMAQPITAQSFLPTDQRIPVNLNPQHKSVNNSVLSQTLPYKQEPFFYSEHAGSEFSSLNDFLSMIDDPDLVHGNLNDETVNNDPLYAFGMGNSGNNISNIDIPNHSNNNGNTNNNHNPNNNNHNTNNNNNNNTNNHNSTNNNGNNLTNILSFSPNVNMFSPSFSNDPESVDQTQNQSHMQSQVNSNTYGKPKNNLRPSTNQATHQPAISDAARDKFFLTAADPTTEISPEERLKQVIKAKLEAGLLQPYNYAKGYARLQSYMDNYMNLSSRQRILKPLSVFRPAFRAIARTLKDVDLVLVEESFERMLLDYDRVFTSMAIPACLWRRTGEIYRGNKEFASLVGVLTDDLKDGKLAIYELMSEESAVNFWEKYGAIAFDKGQKAVLTSCNLRTKDGIKRKSCCFSFTIRRDRYNIPSCIVGNFIPIDP